MGKEGEVETEANLFKNVIYLNCVLQFSGGTRETTQII